MTEKKSLALAGEGPGSTQLKQGIPIFYHQLMISLKKLETEPQERDIDQRRMEIAARENDEEELARASGRPHDAALAKQGGLHGSELWRLGYTLSHVVHAYGAMCQSITELAGQKKFLISVEEFRDLNRCLDVAIAGAVTAFQSQHNLHENSREAQHLGFLAHEMRNTLTSAKISFQMVKKGTVGLAGSTGRVLEKSLNRLEGLIERSLTEVRLRVDPKVYAEPAHLLQIVDQIVLTASVEAAERGQSFDLQIDPDLVIEVDQHLFYSAISNLVSNALKYTHYGGTIRVRASSSGATVVIEVEDQCGGLKVPGADLFKPFVQLNENRQGMGLGLTIAKQAVMLSNGTLEVRNLPGLGCVFVVTLPLKASPGTKLL